MQVFLVPSHSPQHTQQEAVVAADQDYNPMVVAVDPVVVEVDQWIRWYWSTTRNKPGATEYGNDGGACW